MRAFGDYFEDDTASAIKARDHKDNTDLVVQPPIAFSHTQGIDAQPSEIHTPTLRREGNGMAIAVPFTPGSIGGYVDGVGTLRASGGDLGGGSETLVVHEVSSRTE